MSQPQLVKEFLEHRGLILGFICALTRNLQVAEEIFQDLGLKVVEHAARGTSVGRFLPWVREVARNLIADHYRKKPRSMPLEEVSGSMAEVFCQAFEENEISSEGTRLRKQYLAECLGRLPERMKDAVERRYRSCASLPSIATAIGWKVDSVKVALSRARKALLDCVQSRLRATEAGQNG